jgi:hypothetical protein
MHWEPIDFHHGNLVAMGVHSMARQLIPTSDAKAIQLNTHQINRATQKMLRQVHFISGLCCASNGHKLDAGRF